MCVGVMSDSEDESQDKQLKIVVIGDGACGKVRATVAGPRVGRGVEMYMQDKNSNNNRGAPGVNLVCVVEPGHCAVSPGVHGNRRVEGCLAYRC